MTPPRDPTPGGGPGPGSSSLGSDPIDFSKLCPDCAAPWVDRNLVHELTCPLGLGYDEIMADDAAWFEQHPGATTRERSAHWAEIADYRAAGQTIPPGTSVVTVTKLAPGVRHKSFTWFQVVWP